jgi:hypothetical protein
LFPLGTTDGDEAIFWDYPKWNAQGFSSIHKRTVSAMGQLANGNHGNIAPRCPARVQRAEPTARLLDRFRARRRGTARRAVPTSIREDRTLASAK